MYNIIKNYVNIFINYVHDFSFVPIENIKQSKEKSKTIKASETFIAGFSHQNKPHFALKGREKQSFPPFSFVLNAFCVIFAQ